MSNEESITIKIACVSCKKVVTLKPLAQNYYRYLTGTYIQDAMPELTPAERELFITGLCGGCFPKDKDEVDQ